MKSILYIPLVFLTLTKYLFADTPPELVQDPPPGSIPIPSNPIELLTIIQEKLLTVVLPVVVVGASLYISYELFTAEGDESKMKKAWKSVAYTAVGLIAIALSYAIVTIISTLSI